MGSLVIVISLQLLSRKGNQPRFELVRQPDDHIDVAVPAEIGAVLVGALEEDFGFELRQPLICRQRVADGYVGLL